MADKKPTARDEQTQQPAISKTGGALAAYLDARGGLGLMARGTRDALVSRMASDRDMQGQIRDDAELLRHRLLGPNPSALEAILVDRVVLAWLQSHHADYVNSRRTGLSLAQADQLQRWQDRAQRRFLSACKALAQVRKLEIHLQVNIADKQVVMAGGMPPGQMEDALAAE